MKFKHILTITLMGLFLWAIAQIPVQTTAAQQQSDVNLLTNPSFEEGYYNQDGIPEIASPNGWRRYWLENISFFDSTINAIPQKAIIWSEIKYNKDKAVALENNPPTPFPMPTPRPDGAIVHIVQENESLWSLAILYASDIGLTAEETLAQIRELNGNPAFITIGQELLISKPTKATTPANTGTESATEETVAGDGSEGTETEVEPTATPEPVVEEPTPEPVAETDPVSAICVSAFDDFNGNGDNEDGEELLADAVFTISHTGGTVATYVSDAMNEQKCFEGLEPNTYQITFSPPSNYDLTTAGNWVVAVSGGDEVSVEFGAQVVAEFTNSEAETTTDTAETAVDTTADITESVTETLTEEGGFFANLGSIFLMAAIVLIVLAGSGVALLRRS